MKFSLKLLLCTIVVMALALAGSGLYFVNYVFETSLEREAQQALEENSILRFAFKTAALNVPARYDVLQDHTAEQLALGLEAGNGNRRLCLRDEAGRALYISEGFVREQELLSYVDESTRAWQVVLQEERYYIQVCGVLQTHNRILYLETMRDISEVFRERELGFLVYRRMMLLMLAIGGVVMYLLSYWLTRPIHRLIGATKRMAAGEYQYRLKQVNDDELGQLTGAFNRMAASLEDNAEELEAQVQDREDFVAAFAHELKTPLTSIIGYADLLRSHKMDEEKSLLSANYIYTEGKRLEAMSLRLLDIIVTRRQSIRLQTVWAEVFFTYLQDMFAGRKDFVFTFSYEKGTLRAEANLIKTVLVNLVDNACKASEPGSPIIIEGAQTPEGYRFFVKDQGMGIEQGEIRKITKAFYMVDKSRARSKNGAGLGLALCREILRLHGSRLEIESEPGKGSCFSFMLPK